MEKSTATTKRLIYVLIIAFCIMGVLTYLIVRDMHYKTIQSNALLIAKVIVAQSDVVRTVYIREIINKLRKDGTGAHTHSGENPGFVPISAQFQRMLSDEAQNVFKDIQYRPVSKWNIGPYGIHSDEFLQWGWQQLETQDSYVVDDTFEWEPVWRVELTPQGQVLKYMAAVPATSDNCVACHQKYEDSEEVKNKRINANVDYQNYRINHLIGAFAITVPLSSIDDSADVHLHQFIIYIAIILIISFIAILWFSTRSLRQTNQLINLTKVSQQDPLTKLLNRRGFNRALDQHLKLFKTENKVFSLCMFDLDGFKLVNDTFGHQAGDEVLKEISNVLHKTFRENDAIARMGGDEFSVILSGCTLKNAQELCNKLLTNIRAINIEWNNSNIKIGASIGVYEVVDNKITKEEIIKLTDAACYEAKAMGKDRVVVA